MSTKQFTVYSKLLKSQQKPAAIIDLDALNRNVKMTVNRAQGKKIRLASKSVRCKKILQHILDADPIFQGVMCYHAEEAIDLAQSGFSDLLVAYPCVDEVLIERVVDQNKTQSEICLMVDSEKHLQLINAFAEKAGIKQPVCIDLDCSLKLPGLHFGVMRSSIRNNDQLKTFLEALKKHPSVRLDGLMGYEAQIAGLGDRNAGNAVMNFIVRRLKKYAIPKIADRRKAAVEMIQSFGHNLRFVNGGGTGSLESTLTEEVVTEGTVGSGFYSPRLFDYYDDFRYEPSAFFALEVTRNPEEGIYTCLGGGYVASGPAVRDKMPIVVFPAEAELMKNEMVGEVQTPITYAGKMEVGDLVFLRHGKSGELLEHFNKVCLIENGEIQDVVRTYRGEGLKYL